MLDLERLQLENALRSALANHEFELLYQPRVTVTSTRVTSVEALLRWHPPARGLITAGEFFDVVYCSEVIEHLLDPTTLDTGACIVSCPVLATRWNQSRRSTT